MRPPAAAALAAPSSYTRSLPSFLSYSGKESRKERRRGEGAASLSSHLKGGVKIHVGELWPRRERGERREKRKRKRKTGRTEASFLHTVNSIVLKRIESEEVLFY